MTPEQLASERKHSWHPFTQMQDWCAPDHEPIMLVSGEGSRLRDSYGREYLDGNSSIWSNLHGHRHPKINAAIREQLDRVAHVSFLGFTHPLAIRLAEELANLWKREGEAESPLPRIFFSDDGSTAIEVALKIAIQSRQQTGAPERRTFVAFENAYHGDTMGASSLGGISVFHGRFSSHQFPCLRVGSLAELKERCRVGGDVDPGTVTAVVIEPLIQGSAGMQLWPSGMLAELRQWCDDHGIYLIVDEVMTGFGRTGTFFACQQEGVIPDMAAVAKGLTGGYLPLAATYVRESIYEAFLGRYEELKTLFYGHTYTANPLGCAAALANLAIFREERVLETLQGKIAHLRHALKRLETVPTIRKIRQLGFIAAFDVTDPEGNPLDWRLQTGAKVCVAARKHGLLTRPIRDVVILMPPYSFTFEEIDKAVEALRLAVLEVTGAA